MDSRRDQALDGWLSAISDAGWRKATLEGAAAASGLTPADLIAALGDRFDALAAFQDRVAQEAALGCASGSAVRERLFDGMMQGFDLLQAHRGAVLALARSRDPGVAALVAGRAGLHVRRLASAAGMNLSGVKGHLRLVALSALCWQAFAAWRADDTADMAGTMAELDGLLGRAERAETEGLSPDLLGLPGLTALFDRLRLPRILRPVRQDGRGDPVPPPSPGPSAE
jgi:hypothetical protein